jgi:hypothetical protein
VKKLISAGVPEKQAEVFAEVQKDIEIARNERNTTVATKEDLKQFATKQELKEMELRLTLRLGVIMSCIAGIVIAVLKL